MPEQVEIVSQTNYKTHTDGSNNIDIITKNESADIQDLLTCDINLLDQPFFLNNKKINSGELSILMKNTKDQIDFITNDRGELFVNAEDSQNYEIDNDGYLFYFYR